MSRLHFYSLNLQVVVEKKIMRERKLTRHDVGRESFVQEVRFLHNVFELYIIKKDD